MDTVTTRPEIEAAHAAALEIDKYKTQIDAWVDRHADTPVIERYRPGTHTLIDYYEADHAEALLEDRKRKPELGSVEYYADWIRGRAHGFEHTDMMGMVWVESILDGGLGVEEQVARCRNVVAAVHIVQAERPWDGS